MDTTDPYIPKTIETHAAIQGNKLNIDPVQPSQIESPDAHWLRMDPALARAVLAKTEEELLSSLAALMRNKVEHEQAGRKLAQIQIDAQEAKHEFETVKQQIRRAEEEVATRLNEQIRVNEEIVRLGQELAILRDEHQRQIEMVFSVRNETALAEQELADAQRNLAPLRDEVDQRIRAREALIAETVILHQHLMRYAADQERLQAGLNDLRDEIAAIGAERESLQQSVAGEEARLKHALKASLEEEVSGTEGHKVAPGWDPYPLESEFHTEEVLDAGKVAELVSLLPGLEGCLIAKNHGAVLASQTPGRIYSHLKVANRNYALLFDRLEKKVEEFDLQNTRLATFDLGGEALTVAQANQAFLLVLHRQTKLLPGVPDKLAAIVTEVAKMYP